MNRQRLIFGDLKMNRQRLIFGGFKNEPTARIKKLNHQMSGHSSAESQALDTVASSGSVEERRVLVSFRVLSSTIKSSMERN